MTTSRRRSGSPTSLACPSISVTPQEETPARNASLFVSASGCGRADESRRSVWPRTTLCARPIVPELDERIVSTLSLMRLSMTRIDGLGAPCRHAAVALRLLLGGVTTLGARLLVEAAARQVIDALSRLPRDVALDRVALRTRPRHRGRDAGTSGLQQQQHTDQDA